MKTVKLLGLILIIVSLTGTTKAQKPEKVYSIVKQIHNFDWYLNQAKLWHQVLEKDQKNTEAWLNYYMANRMAKLTGNPEQWTNDKSQSLKELNLIVDEMEKAIPNSFEFNYIKFYNNGYDPQNFPYLEKAYRMNPERVESYDNLVTYYEINRLTDKKNEICQKWFRSNDISTGILSYGYNLLQSVDKNALIFTNGDNDTYPLWLLQEAKDIRKDVTVLNINLLMIDGYREKIFKELEIPKFDMEKDKIKSYIEAKHVLIKYITNNAKNPVYFSTTIDKSAYDSFGKDIYIEGLAFKYSQEKYDNIAVLKKNYEKNFLLDYLKINLQNDLSESVVKLINSNYLLPFLTLYEHYKLSEENQKLNEIKALIIKIAEDSNRKNEIEKYIE